MTVSEEKYDNTGCAMLLTWFLGFWFVISMVSVGQNEAEAGAYNRAMETLGRDERTTAYETAGCTGGVWEKTRPVCWFEYPSGGVEP